MAGQPVPGILQSLYSQFWDYRHVPPPRILHEFWESNMGLQVCTVSTLLTGLSHQSGLIFFLNVSSSYFYLLPNAVTWKAWRVLWLLSQVFILSPAPDKPQKNPKQTRKMSRPACIDIPTGLGCCMRSTQLCDLTSSSSSCSRAAQRWKDKISLQHNARNCRYQCITRNCFELLEHEMQK